MSSLKLYGSTSGYVEIVPEATAGNNSVILPSGSGSLVVGDNSGNINISGVVTASQINVGTGVTIDSNGINIGVSTFYGDGSGLTGISGGTSITQGNTSAEVIDTGSDGRFVVTTEGTERARIDSSGRLLVGTTSSSTSGQIHVRGPMTPIGGGITLEANLTASFIGANDPLGRISFGAICTGSTPAASLDSARIEAVADGTWGSNSDVPSRLVFSTTADGASTPTERMRIANNGQITSSASGQIDQLVVDNTDGFYNSYSLIVADSSTSASGATGWGYFRAYSSNRSDTEFWLRGDGVGLCDQSWNGGGADYAEYFEWSDSNPAAEDRRGISVVLDGDKIRPAIAGEDPIGVISGNPSVVGDSAWNKWSGKYLRDDYGAYIQEDYEVVNDEGETIVQQRRKLNPDFDPDVEYISREERPEWDCVGLMGKLRIRKGQPVGARWIKMRDISDTVEEWLVR